jgi:hypothetical protein
VVAGAPEAERDLSPAELAENLRYFTVGLRGPRSRPCTGLILSGAGLLARPDLPTALEQARAAGIVRVVAHGSPVEGEELPRYAGAIDLLVLNLQPEASTRELAVLLEGATLPLALSVVLGPEALSQIQALLPLLQRFPSPPLTFTWPYAGPAPSWAEGMTALRLAESALGRRPWSIKGLPPCLLGPLGTRVHKSMNRWYVDAAHQRERALRFFPDVLRLRKVDHCRFCEADPRCDGMNPHLIRPGYPATSPLDPAPCEA